MDAIMRSSQTKPPPCHSPTFKLRPRSNSHQQHDVVDATGLTVATTISPIKPPQRHGVHTISPDGPMHPANDSGNSDVAPSPNKMPPPPSFSSFFAMGRAESQAAPSSPIKKQKIHNNDRLKLQLSPDTSPSDKSEDEGDSSSEDSPYYLKSPAPMTNSSNTTGTPPIFPTFPPLMAFPSTPPTSGNNDHGVSSNRSPSSSNGKRSRMPTATQDAQEAEGGYTPSKGDNTATSAASSPFTPKGRAMMQNLCIHSPSSPTTLSSMSPTPGSQSSTRVIHNQNLPSVPTFSFSPSLRLEKDCIFPMTSSTNNAVNTTTDSSQSRVVFSAGSTPLGTPSGTPKRSGPRSLSAQSASANSSPFHSRTPPIGHQRGSVFKTLPPRLYPNGRDDCASSVSSLNESTTLASTLASSGLVCSSPSALTQASSSPRVVPLTVLSRGDGSPAISPKTSPGMPSPLMKSLCQEEESNEDLSTLLSPRNSLLSHPLVKVQPRVRGSKNSLLPSDKVDASPLSASASITSGHLLPRIKLTPRGNNFASAKLSPSSGENCGGGLAGGLTVPRLTHLRPSPKRGHNIHESASSFVLDSPGDREAAEMDSLLSGFEHHRATATAGNAKDGPHQDSSNINEDTLGRVESEELEVAALTQGGPFHVSALWLPPPKAPSHGEHRSEHRRSSFTISECEASSRVSSPGGNSSKPMPSITLNLSQSGGGQQDASQPSTSPNRSFLPRSVHIAQNQSRSLFDTSTDPLEGILRADAIAEAARSDEPLTDDEDSVIGEECGSDFLLCLPKAIHPESEGQCTKPSPKTSSHPEVKFPSFKSISSHASFRAESPLFNRRSESPSFSKSRSGSFRRSKCSDHSLHGLSSPTTPTIFEEGFVSMEKSTSAAIRPFHPVPTTNSSSEGLNKRETSDATFATFCTLSDCDPSDIISSPKYQCRTTRGLGASRDRSSVCSLLSTSSLCGLDIVHEKSLSVELDDKVPVLLPSESTEFMASMYKPIQRSEFSMNSLGLSVDSSEAGGVGRDLFTPPVGMMMRNSKSALSPPPLLKRGSASPLPFEGWKR